MTCLPKNSTTYGSSRMRHFSKLLLIPGAILLFAGCNKQNSMDQHSRQAGTPVVFNIGANAETRTVYGDFKSTGGTKIQDINWVNGDRIRVYSPEAKRNAGSQPEQWADYVVTPTASDPTRGTLSNVQPIGLSWNTDGTYHFYSVYPSPETVEEAVPADGTAGKFSFSIPAAQTPASLMQYAYMTAAAQVTTTESDNAVTLEFYPAFTAFEFELTGEEEEITLDELSIESASGALTGAFTVTYAGTSATYVATGTGKKVTLTLPANTVMSNKAPVTCTVLALPVDVTDLTLSVVRTYNGTQVSHSLALKRTDGTFLSFAARKKHRLTGIITPVMLQMTTFDVTTGSWQTWTHTNTVLGN